MNTPISELDVSGIGPSKRESIREAGYNSLEELGRASKEDLAEINGIGDVRLHKLLLWLEDNEYRNRTVIDEDKEELLSVLEELFQLDNMETREFGTAKILREREEEIRDFINYELSATIDSQVEKMKENVLPDMDAEIEEIEENLGEDAFIDPDDEIGGGGGQPHPSIRNTTMRL